MINRTYALLGIFLCLLITIILPAPQNIRAQNSVAMLIYDDTLSAEWQDRSWPATTVTNYANTAPVKQGNNSISGSYGGSWAGFRLKHDSVLLTASFTDLQFWFQSDSLEQVDLSLQDETLTVVGNKIRLTPTALNTWQQVTIPMANFGATSFQFIVIQGRASATGQTIYLDEIALLGTPPTATPTIAINYAPTPVPGEAGNPFYETWYAKTAPTRVQTSNPFPTSAGTTVAITVDPTVEGKHIYPTQLGNNAGVWMGDSHLLSAEAFDQLSQIAIPFIRFPGGSTSDSYHWNAAYLDDAGQPIGYPQYIIDAHNPGFTGSWAVSTYEFLSLAESLGAIPLITVNHGYATYDTTATDGNVENAAALAADWVEYANAPNDGSNPNGGIDWAMRRSADGHPEPFGVRYWTVGNETFGSWEVGYQPNGADYAAHFNVIYDAMKAVDPSIYIGAVGGFEDYATWFSQVLSYAGTAERIDFIDVHNYYHFVGTPGLPLPNEITEEAILDLPDSIARNKAELDELFARYTTRQPGEVPYLYGEFNATNAVNYHHVQLANGLFFAEAIGQMITNGFVGAMKWDIYNAWSETTQGDMGMFAKKNPNVPDHTPYPSYYPYYFYGVNFGDKLVEATTTNQDELVVYASRFSADNNLALIIINKTGSKTAQIDLGRFAIGDVNGWSLSGDGLDDFSVTLNGVANGFMYGGPRIDEITPYYLDGNGQTTLSIGLEGYSITSLVLYADTTTATSTPTATNTPVTPTATNTPVTPTATNTPVTPTATNTPVTPMATNTPAVPLAVQIQSAETRFPSLWLSLPVLLMLFLVGLFYRKTIGRK